MVVRCTGVVAAALVLALALVLVLARGPRATAPRTGEQAAVPHAAGPPQQ
ncbi:hypothetical protein OG802_29200 [Streptomyces sp. NBC_00704]|nr:hypothetical protein [Streptomyces sp. NBC_00704]